MSTSTKDTFAANIWGSRIFGSGIFRGTGVQAIVITPPFRCRAKDAFVGGSLAGMAHTPGATAQDAYATGPVTGSSDG